ncbi:hypothetical protein QR680_009922 [Steinernema hermaphroditum]|uniref:Uncharacterized protein n=1 Tax=Steinernema hermaphroditum TaxID=289476 RepID=A0AA39IM42_9BILA|nr:hypothetical protein QR680_009922 [Steinernema hermaphroditum]
MVIKPIKAVLRETDQTVSRLYFTMRTLAALLLLLLVVVCIIGSSNAACGPLGSIAGGVPCRRYVEAVSERRSACNLGGILGGVPC